MEQIKKHMKYNIKVGQQIWKNIKNIKKTLNNITLAS